jgi:hypothetical protein
MDIHISIASVSERDIDLLLLEEFVASSVFCDMFIEQAFCRPAMIGKCIDACRSVTDSNGESDLEVTFANVDGLLTRFLIENKIGAGLQPLQAERYRLRGSEYVSRSVCTQYYSVIVAPSRYFGQSHGTKGFDRKITYETILEWFRKAEDLGNRRYYKVSLLKAAIAKGTLGYQPEEDAAASSFWRDYWLYSCKHAPGLEMREPKEKPAGSTFVAFFPPELPRGVDLVHKFAHGYVDLQIGGAAFRLNGLRADIGNLLEEGMEITKAGKSAAVRLRTPKLYLNATAVSQAAEMLAGLKAAMRLLKWFCMNTDAFASYTHNCPTKVFTGSRIDRRAR